MSRTCVVTVVCVVTVIAGALPVPLPNYPVHAQNDKDGGEGYACRNSYSGPLCGDAQAGKKIYENDGRDRGTHCILCHGADGKGRKVKCLEGSQEALCAPDLTSNPSIAKSPTDLRKTFDKQADKSPTEGQNLDYGAKNDVMAYVECLRHPHPPCP